ncbi:hypothetical protein PFISCL1PPCAC_24862, partial [Pristionchus fissidentatus]
AQVTQPPSFGIGAEAPIANGLGIEDPRRPGQQVTLQQAQAVCAQISRATKSFGIRDIAGFARNNCVLIQGFYAGITCAQIEQLVSWCQTSGLL